ncbi:MAG TPA: FtsQ-type POTRA domain-containing protein [Bryobacteraceae bacterium]|nr:FtsQ-type POTRA domain-containing protein [Bryobacteraceae bacterium]
MAREKKSSPTRSRWRLAAGIILLGALSISTAMAAFKVHEYVIRDPQFLLLRDRKEALTVEGLRYASRAKVVRVFAPDFDRSIFSVPLEERRRRLLAIDWIEDASISRVWPDRLVVRIRERKPVAFIFLRSGVLLIDAQGVLLDPPAEANFSFPVLSGVREDESEPLRREQVRALLRLQDDLGPLAKDISEVNAADPNDLRMVAQVDSRAIELAMGEENFGRRYRNFLNHYPDIKHTSPDVNSFDLRLDDRITAKGIAVPWQ